MIPYQHTPDVVGLLRRMFKTEPHPDDLERQVICERCGEPAYSEPADWHAELGDRDRLMDSEFCPWCSEDAV